MDLREKHPKLANLIGGYLHQDWEYDYDWKNTESHYAPVVRFFKTHNPQSTIEQATIELKEFLTLNLDEEHLEDVLHHHFVLQMSVSYWNLTYREWLEDVLKILEEPVEKTKKEFIPEFVG